MSQLSPKGQLADLSLLHFGQKGAIERMNELTRALPMPFGPKYEANGDQFSNPKHELVDWNINFQLD